MNALSRSFPPPPLPAPRVADPSLRRSLMSIVRRSVPEREVEDIVQETLLDALVAKSAPTDPLALLRWAAGIARHKVVDFHRRKRPEEALPPREGPQGNDNGWDLLRWAERSLPAGPGVQQAFSWLLREGQGETLEDIARTEEIAAQTVRQRVARLRRHLRARWATEAAAFATLVAFILVALGGGGPRPPLTRDAFVPPRTVQPAPPELATEHRLRAAERCAALDFVACLAGLDEAAGLDPPGDEHPTVRALRNEAERRLKAPAPTPPPTPGASLRRESQLPGDTAPAAPNACVCARGDPLCGCL